MIEDAPIAAKDALDILFPMRVSGIVTMKAYTYMPDGLPYNSFWASDIRIGTDKQFPVDGFHSSERWQLYVVEDDQLQAVFPGCMIGGLCIVDRAPARPLTTMYIFPEDN